MPIPLTLEVGVIYVTKVWSDSWSVFNNNGSYVGNILAEGTRLKLIETGSPHGSASFEILNGLFKDCTTLVHKRNVSENLLERG